VLSRVSVPCLAACLEPHVSKVYPLSPSVKGYFHGSRGCIAQRDGTPPIGRPEHWSGLAFDRGPASGTEDSLRTPLASEDDPTGSTEGIGLSDSLL